VFAFAMRQALEYSELSPLPLLRSVKRRHDSQPLESLFSSYAMPNRHCCSIFRQLHRPLYHPATYRKIRKIQTF